ncbi:antichymotrypsin-2-like [Bicyclus anynana]|uniref:Antichymotrypsin-2-like n=1 Tax=Bicyclus anynana TaxID=110368 RepID=A0ABM3LHS8_BICAN|nr:antichymotrypsin-2-like [Bicyclus anynana]
MSNENTTDSLLQVGSNQFTSKMFTEVAKANPQKNFILSAISVMPPLAELALASVGASHDELLAAIGMPSDDTAKAVFSYANKELNVTKGITLKTASKIYVRKNYTLNDDFVAVAKDVFDSEVTNIDFNDKEKTAAEINNWVSNKTNNRIKDIVNPQSIDGDTKAILVNAIYFKGIWVYKFDEQSTKDKDFHVSNNHVIQIPMMFVRAHFDYTESIELKSQIIEIPYTGNQASLVVVLPYDIGGIVELLEKLKDPNVIDNALKDKYKTEVELTLPKFKIETTTDLTDILKKIGVTKLFDATESRLNNMLKNTEDLYIDSATQKAFIEVNEEGTEAAAANSLSIMFMIPPSIQFPPIQFNANKPFYYAIRMNSLTLFNGVMYGH